MMQFYPLHFSYIKKGLNVNIKDIIRMLSLPGTIWGAFGEYAF